MVTNIMFSLEEIVEQKKSLEETWTRVDWILEQFLFGNRYLNNSRGGSTKKLGGSANKVTVN